MENFKEKYKKALEKAKNVIEDLRKGDDILAISDLEQMFPELAESEDEKIRKELLEHCKNQAQPYIQTRNKCPQIQSWIDWLERQGEQNEKMKKDIAEFIFNSKEDIKHRYDWIKCLGYDIHFIDKEKQGEQKEPQVYETEDGDIITYSETDGYKVVEPKFKVGDWIANDYCVGKVIALTDDAYLLDSGQGIPFSCEHNAHLWTIQDAKDGDVLKEDSCMFIIERMKPNGTAIVHCCLFDDGDFDLGSTLSFDVDSTYPATKEQRDFLFSKIKEAGYEWDAEKKELKKIEQKPTYMVKPKFKVGDWIVDKSGLVQQVLDFRGGIYTCTYNSFITDCESNYHLWTIQDAKEGDVLVTEDKNFTTPFIAIYKSLSETYAGLTFNSHCFIGFNGNFNEGEEGHSIEDIHLATKEQRDLLFQKMHEAGYEWDAEKKELSKIEQKPTDIKIHKGDKNNPYDMSFEEAQNYITKRDFDICCTDKAVFVDNRYILQTIGNILKWADDNPKREPQLKEGKFYECIKSYHYLGGGEYWFDEGKVYFCEKNGYLRLDPYHLIYVDDCENWQNYFRPYTGKTVWSEEDEKMFRDIAARLHSHFDVDKIEYDKSYHWLKSLKDRVQPQPKQEWSEEDKERIEQICDDLKCGLENFHSGKNVKGLHFEEIIKSNINWLKSLRPQPKQEWSEEDETKRNALIGLVEEIKNQPLRRLEDWDGYISWLKSLKPQNHWKPSDEQIKAFEHFVRSVGESGYASPYDNNANLLYSLLEQLKKLKENKL